MAELWELGARELRDAVRRGEVSCREIADAHLGRIELTDAKVRALVTFTPEAALESADRWDRARANGDELPPLAGVPLALKDNMCTRGVRTTCGSRILGDWRPPYDATVTDLTRAAGCLLVGKADRDEFAMG